MVEIFSSKLAAFCSAVVLFGGLLTNGDADFAGRPYATYRGIYIAASLAWLSLKLGWRSHLPLRRAGHHLWASNCL
jgi:drug/metabolite transporter superfamily protein YnfA